MALTDGCIAYWNLNDDGSGGVSLVDSTGNGNTLVNSGGVALDPNGIIDQAASIDAGSQFSSSTLIVGSWPLSYSSWIQSSTVGQNGAWGGISTGYPGFFRTLAIDGDILFQAPNAAIVSTTSGTYNDGAWHYVVGVADGTNIYLYVDGVLVASDANTSTSSSGILFINGEPGESYGSSNMDEVGIWDRGLSPSEVTTLYNNGAGNTYPFNNILYYNNAQNDGDWGNILNWWRDSEFTTQATALPTATNPINLYNEVTQNTQGANQCFCSSGNFWSANFGAGLTLQATGVVNMQGTSLLAGTTTDGVSMHDSSQLTSTSVVDGNVVMRDSSRAFGSILGNAIIYYDNGNGQYPIGGTVSGSVSYIGWPAISPQWFNDEVAGGADDGDFSNQANWWTDNTYTTRPINAKGYQQLPDPSTDVFIAPNTGIYANTGDAILVNSITANNGYISNITLTVSNGIIFSGNGNYGTSNAIIYADVTFSETAYNDGSAIHGNADYKSSTSLVESFNQNSLGKLTSGASYGSNSMTVTIAGGTSSGTNWISRLLHLPWFINV